MSRYENTDGCVVPINVKPGKTMVNTKLDTIVYTVLGKEENQDSDGNPLISDKDAPHACAMKSPVSKQYKYYIKRGGTGNRLFNPVDNLTNQTGAEVYNGVPRWQYREVNKTAFDYYLFFLKTKNPKYYTLAEREVI